MQYDISKYDYIIFVDASGDDGFKFDKDSSKCYSVAAVIVDTRDIQYNLDKLDEIKQCIGARLTDELKYTKLRRNKKYAQIIDIMAQLKCSLFTYTAIKEILPEADKDKYTKEKYLSQLSHIFSIETATNVFQGQNPKVLIAIDVMKKVEMDGVNSLVDYCVEKKSISFRPEVIFRDSKDKDFKLIQIADVFSGFTRNLIEQLYEERNKTVACKTCFKTGRIVNTKKSKIKCSTMKNILRNQEKEKLYLKKLIHLFGIDKNGSILLEGLSFLPVNSYCNFYYIDCIYNPRNFLK